jgi:hypothetical protein
MIGFFIIDVFKKTPPMTFFSGDISSFGITARVNLVLTI